MTTESNREFSDDRPIDRREDDRLDRAPFASRVAQVLKNLPSGDSLIVGVHGPWGDGKTTVLNFIRAELSEVDRSSTEGTSENVVLVRDFNPWRLTTDEAILRGFFSMLARAIGASLSTKTERARERARKWATLLRWITKPISWFWKPAETVDEFLGKLSKIAASGNAVAIDELRDRIFRELEKSTNRIVVLIDDIDRLDKDETHILFRLIKACADFPNLCYVLAFDEIVVAKALGERYGSGDESSGRAFLEKIIQIPLKLPAVAKEDLMNLCFERVTHALDSAKIELSQNDVDEFVMSFQSGVSVRLSTPRTAKRYGNNLMFALPMLKDEVNTVDLLLVEALRAFYPEIYEIIRNNYADFTGDEPSSSRTKDAPRSKQHLEPIIESMPIDSAKPVIDLLIRLFPRLSGVYGRVEYSGSSWLSSWTRDRRICSPQYCPRYFAYTVSSRDISDAEIADLVAAARNGDETRTAEILTTSMTNAKTHKLIEKLRNIEKDIDAKAVEYIVIGIAKLAQNIPDSKAMFNVSLSSQAGILISHLIGRLPSGASRLSVAKQVVTHAIPIRFGAECVRWLRVTDEEDKEDRNTLSEDEIRDVRLILVERIKKRSKKGEPLFDLGVTNEKNLLFEWQRAEGREPVQKHLLHVFQQDPGQIAKFLQSMAPLAWTSGAASPHISDLNTNNLDNIELIFDLDELASLIREHIPGPFDNMQIFPRNIEPLEKRLAEQFMFLYNERQADERPHSPSHESEASE